MRFFAVALIFFGAASYGQSTEVPHKMQFAGITLTIRDDAKREIQKDVDALTQHPRYFGVKVERAKTYFPIIEKIFEEERLPLDFKFLALQESALISDAVSVSDAVGFWQFKDFTAMEMGLRVDKEVDERMNLISATRAAARYLKQNNYMFNNWLYALQSYQMGAGGVQRSVGDQHNGAKHMEITSETYWYVKKYLAHKVAFENAVSGEPQLKVVPLETNSGKSLQELAGELSVPEDRLKEFNKWAKNGVIPTDKTYTVLIPAGEVEDFTKLNLVASKNSTKAVEPAKEIVKGPEKLEAIFINEVPVVMARKGETPASLANRAAMDLSDFLKYNDISIDHRLQEGLFYFLGKKKSKASSEFYKPEKNESVWLVSQRTGVQLKKIRKYNGLSSDQMIAAGSMIWLNGPKPKSDVMPSTDVVAEVDEEEFEWDERPQIVMAKAVGTSKIEGETKAVFKQDSVSSMVASPKSTEYSVSQGETLYSIAKSNHVEIVDLLQWNNLTITDGLKPGQVLKLTAPANNTEESSLKPPVPPQIHEVQASDTLYSVARKYGVTIKELLDWNEKTDLSLTVGEKLMIMQR